MFESLERRCLMSAGGVSVAEGDVSSYGITIAMGDGSVRMVQGANGGVWKTTNFLTTTTSPSQQQIIAVLIG
jgi:hypothetical protein